MIRKLVVFVVVVGAGAVFVRGVAQGQIVDPKCADKANNYGRKVSAKENKEIRGCIKDEGDGVLMGTVEACLTADPDSKVQAKKDKVIELFATGGQCEGDGGTDLVTDAATINTAHIEESIALAHDIFGADLDGGQISQGQDESKCQYKLSQRTGQAFDAWVKQFRKCKKAAMDGGATSEAQVIAACLSATAVRGNGSALVDPDQKASGKLAKVSQAAFNDCIGEGLDLDVLAPGACVDGGVQGDVALCLLDLVECRACEAVRRADGLAIDCDVVDNDVIGTCPPQPLPPAACEILNAAECLLPYPSSHFLVTDGSTDTGLRVNLPAIGMPTVTGPAFSPTPYNELDGFSPMTQVLMHFPQGVDLALSDAARLLEPECCGQPLYPPWIDTRTYTDRSLDSDSPSVLMKASNGQRVLHWLEIDAHATGNQIPGRQAVFLRPAVSLEPGERYIVAMRNLKTPSGANVLPEGPFAALRDGTLTGIQAIEDRRAQMESDVLDVLDTNGVPTNNLVLAFDFTVQSENQLTRQVISMRDQAYTWLDTVAASSGEVTFTVDDITPISDCTDPDDVEWKRIGGTFESPLFLTGQPVQTGVQFLNVDGNDLPVQNGFMNAPYDISIPCSVFNGSVTSRPIVLGHGIFGTGKGMIETIPNQKARFGDWTYIAGGTDWIGLSDRRDDSTDLLWVGSNIIGLGSSQLNNFPAFTDRLRQGMLNTLVLAKMMKLGLFNRDPAFEEAPNVGVFPGPSEDEYYYGISLGGIHGTLLSALTPDIERFGLDVGAINFACLLQRSTQFDQFELVLQLVGITDPIEYALFVDLINELWVSTEPAGFARHITTNPLPGSGSAKKLHFMWAWLDKQVSNQCTETAMRTMGVPNLDGSILQSMAGIPDVTGPVDSGFILHDTGAFDILNPLHQPLIPALANDIPSPVCDPHNMPRNTPATVRSLLSFLQPGGQVDNFCNGLCDADSALEIRDGGLCDSSSPPALQNTPCGTDADCGGGTCVAVPICDPLNP